MMRLLFILASVLQASVNPVQEIARLVQERGWCNDGVAVERIAFSRPLAGSSGALSIITDPPYGSIRFSGAFGSGTAFIRCHQSVAVAKNDLKPRERLETDNVQFVVTEISPYFSTGVFRALAQLESFEVRGFVKAGTVLSRMQLQPQHWVVAGEPVNLVVEKSGLKISTQVKALQGGTRNDWVRVENVTSRKVVMARVTAPQTVTR